MEDIQQILDDSSILAEQALAKYRERRKALDAFEKQHKHDRSSSRETSDEVRIASRQWYTESVVLFVTRRECSQCGHVALMPEPDLMVKSRNYQRNIVEIVPKPLGLIPPHLQREIIYHDMPPTKACERCFHGLADTSQMDLFNPRLEYPIHSEYPEQQPEVIYKMEDL